MRWLVALGCIAAGCGGGEAGGAGDAGAADARAPDADIGGYCAGSHLVYLNRGGGTYTDGGDNSVTDESGILVNPTATIPPYDATDASWTELMTCVKRMVAPFDIAIRDTDPLNADHVEIVIGGISEDVGFPAGYDRLSTTNCDRTPGDHPQSIEFVFTGELGPSEAIKLCSTIGYQIGAAHGLEAVLANQCPDTLSYAQCEGQPEFSDTVSTCGYYDPEPCACPQPVEDTQNSYRKLMDAVGPASCE